MDIYDASLTRTQGPALSLARDKLGGAAVNGMAIFPGGGTASAAVSAVDVLDASLTRTTLPNLPKARGDTPRLAGAVAGDLALFAGGLLNPVDVVKVS